MRATLSLTDSKSQGPDRWQDEGFLVAGLLGAPRIAASFSRKIRKIGLEVVYKTLSLPIMVGCRGLDGKPRSIVCSRALNYQPHALTFLFT